MQMLGASRNQRTDRQDATVSHDFPLEVAILVSMCSACIPAMFFHPFQRSHFSDFLRSLFDFDCQTNHKDPQGRMSIPD
jgi:hypothetical protein